MRPEMGNAVAGTAGGVIRGGDGPRPPAPTGAVHSADIEYVMGNLAGNPVFAWTPDDHTVSETFQSFVANFVKTGNPNGARPAEVARRDRPGASAGDADRRGVEGRARHDACAVPAARRDLREEVAAARPAGSTVHYLMASPLARGLFHRAVVEGGGSSVGLAGRHGAADAGRRRRRYRAVRVNSLSQSKI